MLIFKNGYLCFNLGRANEDVLVEFSIFLKLMDCYKTFLDNILCIDDGFINLNYTSDEFLQLNEDWKWLDECDWSNDDEIEFYQYNPSVDSIEKYYFGDGSYSGSCWPGYVNAISPLSNPAGKMMFDYAFNILT